MFSMGIRGRKGEVRIYQLSYAYLLLVLKQSHQSKDLEGERFTLKYQLLRQMMMNRVNKYANSQLRNSSRARL